VGATGKDLGPLPDAGAAYVFYRGSSNNWGQQARLIPSEIQIGDLFGISVAITGNKVVVGASELNPYGDRRTGKAFVFNRSGTNWSETDLLWGSDGQSGDGFGHSVAIDGDYIIVGAYAKDPNFGSGKITNAGAAYIFEQASGGWEEQVRLTSDEASAFDHFGRSVAIYNDSVVVGAEGQTQGGESNAGAVYVFGRSGADWLPLTKAVTDPANEGDEFGGSVALFGNWFITGAAGRGSTGEAFATYFGPAELPDTGFAPGQITTLPVQPAEQAYMNYSGSLVLEIPRLGVNTEIVGVPKGGSGWNVDWLWNQAGYLDGTAFPTWAGNTGIAAHKTLPNGEPGPFTNLSHLSWGDEIVIHAWGQQHVYKVRGNALTPPRATTMLDHKDLDWITLITCDLYNEETGEYAWRRVVRAVLVSVESE
jgi:LPXTG-site transpeptidase (sortase) family protein